MRKSIGIDGETRVDLFARIEEIMRAGVIDLFTASCADVFFLYGHDLSLVFKAREERSVVYRP